MERRHINGKKWDQHKISHSPSIFASITTRGLLTEERWAATRARTEKTEREREREKEREKEGEREIMLLLLLILEHAQPRHQGVTYNNTNNGAVT